MEDGRQRTGTATSVLLSSSVATTANTTANRHFALYDTTGASKAEA